MDFYFHPVYLDAEGNIYLCEGSGMSSTVTEGVRFQMSKTLKEEATETDNGRTSTSKTTVTIHIQSVTLPEEYAFVWMDDENNRIACEICPSASLPAQLTAPEHAAYLVAEAHSIFSDDTHHVTRSICAPTDDTRALTTYVPLDDTVCIKQEIPIFW